MGEEITTENPLSTRIERIRRIRDGDTEILLSEVPPLIREDPFPSIESVLKPGFRS